MIRIRRPETPVSAEEILAQYPELKGVPDLETQVAANKPLAKLFEVIAKAKEDPEPLKAFEEKGEELLYGPEASQKTEVEVNNRKFGVEIYEPKEWADKKVWVVAMHGYAGCARDYSRLAEMINGKGWGLLSFDMHVNGKDPIEKMSMNIDEWADVGLTAPEVLKKLDLEHDKLIFVGQSSGGSSGAEICIRNEEKKVYDAAVLVSPTLTTTLPPGAVEGINLLMRQHTKKGSDIIAFFRWLSTVYKTQIVDETLNKLYKGFLSTRIGMPIKAAEECFHLPKKKLLNRLHKINIPTIMMRGEEDDLDKKSLKAAAKVLPENSPVQIMNGIEGCAHQFHIGRPQVLLEQIEEAERLAA